MSSSRRGTSGSSGKHPGGRPFLGVVFDCCGVYQRVYLGSDSQTYRGRCPRCLRTITFRVDPNGTAQRIFRAR